MDILSTCLSVVSLEVVIHVVGVHYGYIINMFVSK